MSRAWGEGRPRRRPAAALDLWRKLLTTADPDTGEIPLNRDGLAAAVGIVPRTVSEIMTELAGIEAITRHSLGRRVRYAVHLRSTERWAADRDAALARAEAAESLVRARGAMIEDLRKRIAAAEAESASARRELAAARREVQQVRSSSRSVVAAFTSACQKMTPRQRQQVPLCTEALQRVCDRVDPSAWPQLDYCRDMR